MIFENKYLRWLLLLPAIVAAVVAVFIFFELGKLGVSQAYTLLWQKTDCVIESSSIQKYGRDNYYGLSVSYTYTYKDVKYTGSNYSYEGGLSGGAEVVNEAVCRYQKGRPAFCYVNPFNPSSSFLEPPSCWVIISLMVVGGVAAVIVILKRKWKSFSGAFIRLFNLILLYVFLAVFLIYGLHFLYKSLLFPILSAKAAADWITVPCEIINAHLYDDGDSDTGIAVLYSYDYDGKNIFSCTYNFNQEYLGCRDYMRILSKLRDAGIKNCHVNPNDPYQAVLSLDVDYNALTVMFPLGFIFIGLAGIICGTVYYVYDKRRRCKIETVGEYVFSSKRARIMALGAVFGFCVFWNFILSIFMILQHTDKHERLFLTIFLIPFQLIGLFSIYYVFLCLFRLFNPAFELRIRPAKITVGNNLTIQCYLVKGDASKLKTFELRLECTKEDPQSETNTTLLNEVIYSTDSPRFSGPVIVSYKISEEMSACEVENLFYGKAYWKLFLKCKTKGLTPSIKDEFTLIVHPRKGGADGGSKG